MSIAREFRDLNVYQQARDAAGRVFRLSKGFPVEERYSLTDQVRRSSRAVGAMIAEAWARRRYKAAFIDKLDQALGEALESQVWLDHALDSGYLKPEDHAALDTAFAGIAAMLSRMIDRAGDFCKFDPGTDYRVMEGEDVLETPTSH